MVVRYVHQPNNTYLTWQRFTYPHPDLGRVEAFSVPAPTYRFIQSAYALMSTMMVVNLWAIVVACGLYAYLRRPGTGNRVNDVSLSLWNRREATQQSVMDTLFYSPSAWRMWWYWPLASVILGVWIASIAAGIYVPSKTLFLGNAAPVDPRSIFVPALESNQTEKQALALNILEIPPYRRAAGAALIASDDVRGKVTISEAIIEGAWEDEVIQRIDYVYNVTGADMGLQKVPELQLSVAGSCRTEHSWWNRTQTNITEGQVVNTDSYIAPWTTNVMSVNLADSPAPSGSFVLSPQLDRGNFSWGIIISAVDRESSTPSDDPWYRTGPLSPAPTDKRQPAYTVRPRRPALSCWEQNTWSSAGLYANISTLQTIVPQGVLSDGMASILARYLSWPVIVALGRHLDTRALQSAQSASAWVFDANSSSVHQDLSQLVLGAYIATVNLLTDTTLDYGVSPKPNMTNMGWNASTDTPQAGAADFVVFSEDVVALSLTVVILIPVLTLTSWVLMHVLLNFTPLKLNTAMESIELFQAVKQRFGEPALYLDRNGVPTWRL